MLHTFVIEPKQEFSSFVFEIWNECNGIEGRVIISESEKRINITKEGMCIINPFDINLNDKKILNQLYKELYKTSNEEYITEKSEMIQGIINYLDNLIISSPYPITYNYDIDEIGLYKLFQLGFDDVSTTLLEKVTDFIKLGNKICGLKIFFFVNLKSYLTETEYQKLYDTIKYEEVILINISNLSDYRNTNEKCYIVDEDLCIIELN